MLQVLGLTNVTPNLTVVLPNMTNNNLCGQPVVSEMKPEIQQTMRNIFILLPK